MGVLVYYSITSGAGSGSTCTCIPESKRELYRKILIIILLSVYIILVAVVLLVTVIVESDSFIEDTLLLTISKEKY